MGEKLEGRRALVTGASRGFGRAIAMAFAREGARVALNYLASQRQADEAVAEAKGLGAEASPSAATWRASLTPAP
jgi:NAD(P)-dependent dehydrogenase (short-subunit alcohol dehydrogenase family)